MSHFHAEAQRSAAAAEGSYLERNSIDAHPAQEEWLTLSGGASTPVVLCVGGSGGQAALAELLSTSFTVRAARDADAALSQLAADTQGPSSSRRCWPDVILLDVSAGLQAINRLHAACPAATPPPPVIVLLPSGAADDGNAERCMAAGAAEIMRFPLARDLLHARIHTQLRLRSTLHEARTSMALLRRMLPDGVISRLKDGQSLIAESMDSVTVLFSDVVSFTSLASEVPTTDLIMMLNELFSAFDVLCDKHKCYKVETIGDAYMVVSGQDGAPDHAVRMLALAADMLAAAEHIHLPRVSCRTLAENAHLSLPHESAAAHSSPHIRLRIGMHSGPAFAGVGASRTHTRTRTRACVRHFAHKPQLVTTSHASFPLLSSPLLPSLRSGHQDAALLLLRRHHQHGAHRCLTRAHACVHCTAHALTQHASPLRPRASRRAAWSPRASPWRCSCRRRRTRRRWCRALRRSGLCRLGSAR
jgi:class 3 adenylate cyclase